MKLTATVELLPTEAQRRLLFQTLEQANAACNAISETAWNARQFGRVPGHHLTYHSVRERFDLTAQMVVRCIGKVVDAYKKDQQTKRLFKKLGAVPYDERILNWHLKRQEISIWLLGGRQVIPFVTGEHQLALLRYQQGESDLVYRKGEFYLFTTCEVPDEAEFDPAGFLGVDLGIVNIATDSDGESCSASHQPQRAAATALKPPHTWSFFDLRQKIAYKAQLHGVPLVLADPRNTSRTCSVCGYTDKRNRPDQSTFSCRSCGTTLHADRNAAINIGRRAAVNPPYAAGSA